MKCINCGIALPDGMDTCKACGAKQYKLPVYYVVASWILFVLCMAYGIVRLVMGAMSGTWTDIYKGAIACCAAIVFIPAIKFMNNAAAVLIIKLVVVAGILIFV